MLRGPRPQPRQRRPCAGARNLPRHANAACIASDPRQLIDDRRTRRRPGADRATGARAGAARSAASAQRSAARRSLRATRIADVIDARLAPRRAFAGHDGTALARALRRTRRKSRPPASLAVAPADYAELFRRRHRRPRRAPAGNARRARAYLRPARSAPAARRPRRARRTHRRHLAAGDAQRSLAVAARCGVHSASICRSGASAFRRTISRSCSGAPEVILTRAAKLGGAPTVPRASCSASRRVAGEARWKAVLRARRTLSRAGARARSTAPSVKPARARRRRRRVAARPAQLSRHRDRGLAARSLHDLRQTHPAAAAARCRRHRRPARATAAPSSTARSANSPSNLPPALPADPLARTARARRASISPRWRIFRKRAPSGGRASCASRAGSSRWESERRARTRQRCTPKSKASSKFPLGERMFTLTGRADRIERLRRRQLRDPRLQDRRGADRKAGAHGPRAAAHAGSRDPARRADSSGIAGRLGRRNRLCHAARRRTRRRAKPIDFKEGTPDTQADHALARADRQLAANSTTTTRPIARWCIRCGRRVTATTTILRASRNGRCPATDERRVAADMSAPQHSRRCAACSSRPPTRRSRPGSPPMPARARRMCWRSA